MFGKNDILRYKLKTNMEVHHHLKVEKKNFIEYLLELLMIFLAVKKRLANKK